MMSARLHYSARRGPVRGIPGAFVGLLLAHALATTALAQPALSHVRAAPRAGTKFVDFTDDLAHATGSSCNVRADVSPDAGIF